jgi:tRNA-2-methylthio-N6-dimethylallyladenosine synthase
LRQETTRISQEEIRNQLAYCDQIRQWLDQRPGVRLACVDTYGCQQNEADSERLRGFLAQMGYGFTSDEEAADIVLLNTCAIREHAEQRVFGNVGALVHTKRRNPRQVICVCGCMAQEAHVAEKLKTSFPHVDLVFGTHMLWKFPELLLAVLQTKKRVFETEESSGSIAEGLPVVRQNQSKAWVSIMYGCNNFCTYCIVPYVRGRERSRAPEVIVEEVRGLASEGYREITLLGQNVNSYGTDLDEDIDFAGLLEQLSKIEGDFLIRFMTSHPKDATIRLFDVMARSSKIAPHLHLPFQSGSSRVLKSMNRGYTREHYLELVSALRERIPHIVLTSDVIVGFPGETQEEFEETLSLIEAVRFDALFTFIFSPREGTPAAKLPDPMTKEKKTENFQRLVSVQNEISAEKHKLYIGGVFRCLVDGEDGKGNLSARTAGGRLVHLIGDQALIGQFLPVRITSASTWALFGTIEGTSL